MEILKYFKTPSLKYFIKFLIFIIKSLKNFKNVTNVHEVSGKDFKKFMKFYLTTTYRVVQKSGTLVLILR